MKTLTLSFVALAALAGASSAQSFDGDDQAPYRPGDSMSSGNSDNAPNLLEEVVPSQSEWINGRYGLTKDPDEARRWSEKN
jgi:hypothetical protein